MARGARQRPALDAGDLPPGERNPQTRELPAWTDDFSNLFRILT
ncbi:MAG: hypothetical protein M5U25_15645 [Planctomycetota bacterium]|nr:hypothetical protein [Planctomycetota bacterium]